MLWNKADIVLEEKKPASEPSEPLSSPLGGPSDVDDGNGGDDSCSDAQLVVLDVAHVST